VNPFVKIAIAAMAATFISPPIMRRIVLGSVPITGEAYESQVESPIVAGAVTGAVTATVFALLGVIGGGPAVSA
jgi:hypothetical protein